ncbi:DUF1223 domain-containing protein [Flagellimonas meishanensis]|uniref:DUF1223 domain-containing protein n=1 Tax=Flagellimonas meishanensis TaxID=2873264 RepID=UPI001CA69CE1|nr:DUF1223 domain-containing protein [[Muricauda] meishanensis]
MFKKIIILSLVFFGLSVMVMAKIHITSESNEVLVENKELAYPPVVVLELFTSQGCSSCPPADALLQKVSKEHPEQVFALSYHVDYWNYIGWRDPFSKAAYTKKQSEYNRKFGYSGNYTPELVVNGREHFVGSNRVKLYSSIEDHRLKTSENSVMISRVHVEGGKVSFHYAINGPFSGKQLRTVLVLDEKTTQVTRGENRNRELRNTHIVVAEDYVPLFASEGTSSIPIPEMAKRDKITLMILVEHENLEIVGAAKVSVP